MGSLFSTVPYQVPSEMALVAAVEEGDKAQPGPGPQMPVTKKDCKGQKKKNWLHYLKQSGEERE